MRHFLYGALLSFLCTAALAQTNIQTTGSFVALGQYSQPQCTLADAPTITINAASNSGCGTAFFVVSPTATRTLAFPTNLQSGGGQVIDIVVNHPATGNAGSLMLANGWRIHGGGQPIWSTANGAVDELVCHSVPSSAPDAQNGQLMLCPSGPSLNIAAVQGGGGGGPLSYINSTPYSECNVSGPGKTCTSYTLNVSSGNTLIVYNWACGNGSCTTPPGAVSTIVGTSGVGTCTRVALASKSIASGGQDVSYCPITGTGSVSVTGTWPLATTQYETIVLTQISGNAVPDGNISSTGTGTGTTATATASGNPTQSDFVFSAMSTPTNPLTWTAGNGQTQIQSGVNFFSQYYTSTSTTTPPTASVGLSGSATWIMSIVPFK